MPILNRLGKDMTDSEITAAAGESIPGEKSYRIDQDIYERRAMPGSMVPLTFLLHHRGQIITQREFDHLLEVATDDPPAEQ